MFDRETPPSIIAEIRSFNAMTASPILELRGVEPRSEGFKSPKTAFLGDGLPVWFDRRPQMGSRSGNT
jgi:hypothetical protein